MENASDNVVKQNTPKNQSTDEPSPTPRLNHCERGPQSNILSQDSSPHQFYPPIPGYLPFYPLPWQYMNYFNLDLMRQLAMELGLRNGGPMNDEVISWNLLKELQMKRNSDAKRRYHGKEQSEDCRPYSPPLCRSCACCAQQLRCSACTHPMSENRVPPCKYCHYVPEPCAAFHDYHTQPSQCYHRCQKPKQPCWSTNHITCDYLPLDTNKKEHPKCCKGSKRPKVERKLVLFNEDNVDVNTKEIVDENSQDSEKRQGTKEAHIRQSTVTVTSKDVEKSNNSESDGDYYTPPTVGSGDKRIARSETSTSVRPDVRRPESYFLPMSSLRE